MKSPMILPIFLLLSGVSAFSQETINLRFDSLPSAQGFTYFQSDGIPEANVFSVTGVSLIQNTIGIGPHNPNYAFFDIVDGSKPFVLTVRARILAYEILPGAPSTTFGFFFDVRTATPNQEYAIGFTPTLVTDPLGNGIAIDTTVFHTYVLKAIPGGNYTLDIDGHFAFGGPFSATGGALNAVQLGDGSGGGANASAEITKFTFFQGCHVDACDANGNSTNPSSIGCVKHFAGPPFSQDGHSTSMNAFFTPTGGKTLRDTVAACSFKGFEWQQIITNLSCPSPFSAGSPELGPLNFCRNSSLVPPRLTATPSFPVFDPPSLGYFLPPDDIGYDPFPFYYPEDLVIKEEENPSGVLISKGASLVLVTLDDRRLEFFDAPQNLCLPGGNAIECSGQHAPQGSFVGFTTRLVGITQDDLASPPLYEWTWTDTYNGARGGISSTSHPLPAPFVDPGGSGGITVTSINGVPQNPPSVTCAASPDVLWPPNGKQVSVNVSGVAAAGTQALDLGSGAFAVTDNQGQLQPNGSINVQPDGTYAFSVPLVPSRDGNNKNGRQYTITLSIADTIGNVGSCAAALTVPHDQGH